MAFKLAGSLNPHGGPLLRRFVAGNSIQVTETDSVRTTDVGFALGVATSAVLGHVKAIVTREGVGVSSDGTAGASFGSFAGTFTFASNNQLSTVRNGADIDISQQTLYSADPDVAIGTTVGNPSSTAVGVYFDLQDEAQIDESSVVATAAQYHSWGIDPEDSGNVIVNIFESSVFTSTV